MQNVRNNIAVSIIVALFLLSLSEITAREAIPQINAETKFGRENEYVLKEYNGLIALYAPGEDSPCEVFDVLVADLPESDVLALTAGICISSDEQLRQMIEDYSG